MACTCFDQAEDLRCTLRYLGAPVRDHVHLFGDSESVVASTTIPSSTLKKRHNILSFHRVREAIASGVYVFTHMDGTRNPADIVSKHWGYQVVRDMLQQLLFNQRGQTSADSTPKGGE